MAIVAFTASVLVVPRLGERWRGQKALHFCAFLAAAVTAAAATAPTFRFFVILFGVGFGALSGAIYILSLEVAAQSRSPQTATPFMVAAFGLGGAVFAVVFRRLVALDWGLATVFSLTGAFAACAVWGFAGDVRQSTQPASAVRSSTSTRPDGPSEVAMVLLWAAFAFGSVAGLMVLGLASAIVEDRGASDLLTSIVVGGVALANTLGRLSVGLLQRNIRPVLIVGISPVIGLAALAVLYATSGSHLCALAIIVLAASYGLMAAGMPVLTRQLCDPTRFGTIFSVIFTGWGAAGLTGPWIAGYLRDQTGDFGAALLVAGGACVLALLSVLLLKVRGSASGAGGLGV